ncbi:hypothetical protein SOVF_182850 [Spinacia oleracea]|uniref:CR-type domain-containing protein n=1 Tax=Spinacia oleracea TaxID=3562 RepID=A0A9R0IP74_SPIOL|nr:uncharacterized protein LOC110792519 [Spinacia oleracea]KNA06250.1 hypothetical protein SOVF_182850 [Spinacia oleracea]
MVGAFQMARIVAVTVAIGSSPTNSSSGNPDDFLPRKSPINSSNSHHHLSISKPSFLVRTQSNVRIQRRRRPEPSCVVCNGSGRVDCNHCHGRGRTNNTDLIMLPKGEWPNWCKTCGGSGLGFCSRCLGTGEYRDIMGFHFMKRESNHPLKHTKQHQVEGNTEHLTAADLLLSQTTSEAEE